MGFGCRSATRPTGAEWQAAVTGERSDRLYLTQGGDYEDIYALVQGCSHSFGLGFQTGPSPQFDVPWIEIGDGYAGESNEAVFPFDHHAGIRLAECVLINVVGEGQLTVGRI